MTLNFSKYYFFSYITHTFRWIHFRDKFYFKKLTHQFTKKSTQSELLNFVLGTRQTKEALVRKKCTQTVLSLKLMFADKTSLGGDSPQPDSKVFLQAFLVFVSTL